MRALLRALWASREDVRRGVCWLRVFRDPKSPMFRRENEMWVELG